MNERYSLRELAIKLDANFEAGDPHVVLTYGVEPSLEESRKIAASFLKRLRRAYRDAGIVLKWVMVTEWANTRVHHHLVLSGGIPVSAIEKIWGQGRARASFLYGDTFRGLAEYLTKETRKTFRDPDSPVKRRFSCSRTVVTPPARTDFLTRADLDADPKPPKGYYIPPESVYRGENPFTGAKYLEYTAIPPADAPRRKTGPRGKKTRPRNGAPISAYRKAAPRQTEMRC
ncbi:MAG: hypothetical protein LBS24_07325 [Clostridiales Family XIII bacterium]|nr:hypothetical protein [Clostridiales Family XIII bacterium]